MILTMLTLGYLKVVSMTLAISMILGRVQYLLFVITMQL